MTVFVVRVHLLSAMEHAYSSQVGSRGGCLAAGGASVRVVKPQSRQTRGGAHLSRTAARFRLRVPPLWGSPGKRFRRTRIKRKCSADVPCTSAVAHAESHTSIPVPIIFVYMPDAFLSVTLCRSLARFISRRTSTFSGSNSSAIFRSAMASASPLMF